ncbi:MAG: methyltransferase domain-containing protein [Armatimonadetes bacterium]|nr:methyltransferase domain-containing protein [Armatimonadota bacterium]
MSIYGGYEVQASVAELYDYVPGYEDRPDRDFYLEYAQAAGDVLELGCGTGRVLIPMAEAGCEVVGIDLSEFMLARCREKLSARPAEAQGRVRLLQGNIADFDIGETFGLITTPFRVFQHLIHVEDQMACLWCARRHLKDGGKLILDLFQTYPPRTYDPVYLEEAEDFAPVLLPDGRSFWRTHRTAAFHRAEQVNDIELIYHTADPGGRTERLVQAFPFRYFFRYEVEHLLARCGLRVASLFGGFDKSPLADDSPEMIFVAEKA